MSAPQRRRRVAVPVKARAAFLDALRAAASVSHAAKQAAVHRQRLYELRERDEKFAAEWDAALEEGTDRLEQQAVDIALNGLVEEVRDGAGNLVTTRQKPDPQMVRYLLSARRPETYSERHRLELAGRVAVAPPPDDRSPSLKDLAKILKEVGAFEQAEEIDGLLVDEQDVAGELEART